MDRNKDVLIELCPKCNRMHTYTLTEGIIDGLRVESITCETIIATEDDEPVLCGYVIEPNDETNMFKVKKWSFRERQKFYKLVSLFIDKTATTFQAIKTNYNPKLMDWAIITTTVKSPFPLNEKKDLDNEDVDGAVLEALYGQILEWNAPPLSQSSVSQRRYTRTTRASSMRTT